MDEKIFKSLCMEYTIKLLELQKVKIDTMELTNPSKEKKCELELIENSIKYLKI